MRSDLESIYDLSYENTLSLVDECDYPQYRCDQIWKGLYVQKWQSFDEFVNLPKSIKNTLKEKYQFHAITHVQSYTSKDGFTEKILFKLRDDLAIETVLMEYKKRWTVCISSQVGCSMGCTFCATGGMGFFRNLSPGEILEQVIYFDKELGLKGQHVTNIVVMGMGEPFNNYNATISAIRTLNHPKGRNLGERRFTISTVGIVPGIIRFAEEKSQINLAISLHSADDTLRSRLLPVSLKYPLQDLMDACEYYINKTGRRITFEWALIDGVNDSRESASELCSLIQRILCHVNVISLNPTTAYFGKGSSNDKARNFCETLNGFGIPCTVRLRRGVDIHAGCGQLAVVNNSVV